MDYPSSSSSARRGAHHCGRPDLAVRLSSGEELSGTFADEIAAHSRGCASCSIKLSLVEQAERWLADHASSNRAAITSATPCPNAEDLYDFGRGPGARALSQGAERRIQAHLVECEDCRALVATLVMRPPVPMVDALPARTVPEPTIERAVGPRPLRTRALNGTVERQTSSRWWIPYAAAAAVLVGALYVWNTNRTSHAREDGLVADGRISYPKPKRLRGALSDALLMPHGRVLASLTPGATGTWHPLHFQVVPRAGATNYKIVVSKTPASAWKPSQKLVMWESPTVDSDLPEGVAEDLTVGKYTWEVWPSVNVLADSIGSRGFEIMDEPAAREAIERGLAMAEPQRSSTILDWLVKNGYEFDALSYAATLPQSGERDDFLAAMLGR
jgi:hypothetical protein